MRAVRVVLPISTCRTTAICLALGDGDPIPGRRRPLSRLGPAPDVGAGHPRTRSTRPPSCAACCGRASSHVARHGHEARFGRSRSQSRSKFLSFGHAPGRQLTECMRTRGVAAAVPAIHRAW